MQKRVTLSIDDSIYEEFQAFCKKNDLILSKRVERFMREELNGEKTSTEVNSKKKK